MTEAEGWAEETEADGWAGEAGPTSKSWAGTSSRSLARAWITSCEKMSGLVPRHILAAAAAAVAVVVVVVVVVIDIVIIIVIVVVVFV